MSNKLFCGSDDDSDNDCVELTTNKDYAKSYNNFRKKELIKKFKDRGYDVSESDSSSDSTSSDEATIDPNFDKEFFTTLASLKSKDPTIYDKHTKFFESSAGNVEDGVGDGGEKKKKPKPVTIKDYERKILLERGGKFEDDSDAEVVDADARIASPTLVEEENQLKADFKQAIEDINSEDEGFGGIFQRREKTQEEQDKDEEDFTKWLAGKQETIESEVKGKLQSLKNYWNSDNLPQSERFLRDYILNKGYANTSSKEIPTYEEITEDKMEFSEDEQELEKQAEFEQKYNFRFEEPDTEFIKRYPRTIESSVRRADDKRKQKRIDVKERKQQEKEQKMKEIEFIKEMKRKEIEEKIQKLKMVTGNEELGFKDEELEEDFDPDKYDKRMQEIFNEEYYQVDEGEEKPECPLDIDELRLEDWDNYDPAKGDTEGNDNFEPHCEDDDFNMDCDYDPIAAKDQHQKELIESTKGRKNRKRRGNRFKEIIQAEKPTFNPEDEKTFAEYIDEYYKIDCEDIIGDIPCRFKYVETIPNDFGLTVEEMLLAKNKELNQWASLKKAMQIRPEYVEKKEQRLYKMKSKNDELKRKIFKSLYGESSDSEDNNEQPTSSTNVTSHPNPTNTETSTADGKKRKKRKNRKAKGAATDNGVAIAATSSHTDATNQTVKSSGTMTEATEKKLKLEQAGGEHVAEPNAAVVNAVSNKTNKKKKNKQKQNGNQNQTPTPTPTSSKTNNNKSSDNKKQSKAEANVANVTMKNASTKGSNQSHTKNPFSVKKMTTGNSLPPIRRNIKNTKNRLGGIQKSKLKVFKQSRKITGKMPSTGGDVNISDERFRAYNINPKKYFKKMKYEKKAQ